MTGEEASIRVQTEHPKTYRGSSKAVACRKSSACPTQALDANFLMSLPLPAILGPTVSTWMNGGGSGEPELAFKPAITMSTTLAWFYCTSPLKGRRSDREDGPLGHLLVRH